MDPAQLRARFPIGESAHVEPHYNIAPGSEVLAVTTDRDGRPRGEHLRWGLVPSWAKDTRVGFKMINARAETVGERPAYRSAFERFRCLIPADGFYEWQVIAGEGRKQPFHITRADGALFAFAGLWSVWHRGQPEELRSCTIITTAANDAVAPIHDRMPVILPREAEDLWLARDAPRDALNRLLQGIPAEEMAARPVGPAVNDARYDGPECLLEPPPPAQDTLFEPPAAAQDTLFEPPAAAQDTLFEPPAAAQDTLFEPPAAAQDTLSEPPPPAQDTLSEP